MPLTNAGRDYICQAIIGTGTFFNNANARICVGDGTGVFVATQTDLLGTNKTRLPMDATFPQVSGNTITFKATANASTANHGWQEVGIANSAAGATLLSRKVENNGTKASGTWTLTVQLQLSVA